MTGRNRCRACAAESAHAFTCPTILHGNRDDRVCTCGVGVDWDAKCAVEGCDAAVSPRTQTFAATLPPATGDPDGPPVLMPVRVALCEPHTAALDGAQMVGLSIAPTPRRAPRRRSFTGPGPLPEFS